jgi:multiple sugar transport system permease protein
VSSAAPAADSIGRRSPGERRRARRRRRVRTYAVALAFMSPWIAGFLAFTLYPMLASLFYSFTDFSLLSNPKWVGLTNYREIFSTDPLFWQAVRNTLWIIAFGVPLNVIFAISIAMLLTRPKRGVGVYRTLFYLPSLVPAVASTLAFLTLLNPGSGPVTQLLRFLHIPQPLWFYDPAYAKPGLLLLGLWGIGNMMVIFLAALLNVPRQMYEAIAIEGANAWQRFRHVTLPLISPVILFAVVTGIIDGFQYFTQAYVVATTLQGSTDTTTAPLGYPGQSTLFYSSWLYEKAFTSFQMGYASAMAWLLFLLTLLATLFVFRVSRRLVHYQGALR